ncbi:MAG: HD domain-containing protein [Clostridiales bacterium]|nr:HD domain-containing protein [Clostridiales bacterium]
MIQKAAAFAARAHDGVMRKGSDIPYIYHPMEVALITAQLTDDEEVIAAAYLHDVLEDTPTTPEELEQAFGSRVLALVQSETEDKSRGWRERKWATVCHLKTASREQKILALGDKLSNMRSTARDYLVIGDAIWDRFHEKNKESHRWYVEGILESLRDLEDTLPYQELLSLYRLVYRLDSGRA